MTWNHAIRELLIALRGRRSQAVVSSKMGFKFNQVYRWESGKIGLSWTNFCEFCYATNAPIIETLLRHFNFKMRKGDEIAFIKWIVGKTKLSVLVKQTGFSRKKIERWLKGRTSPSLVDLLTFIDKMSSQAWDILLDLCPQQRIPESLRHLNQLRIQKSYIANHPYALLVVAILETKEYKAMKKYEKGFFAEILQISLKEEQAILHELLQHGFIALAHEKYESKLGQTFRSKPPSFEEHSSIINYWMRQAQAVLKRQVADGFDNSISMANYRIILANPEDIEEIIEKTREFYRDIGLILKASSGENASRKTLRVMSTQIFDPLYIPLNVNSTNPSQLFK